MSEPSVPAAFARRIAALPPEGGPSGADWLADLPRTRAAILEEWGLVLDGPPRHGRSALVHPVRSAEHGRAVLKLGWPHEEAATEHLALRAWGGRGAVRLLRADPSRSALLLERLTGEDLTGRWDEEACRIVGALYRQLHVRPYPQASRLSAWARRQSRALGGAGDALPRRMVERARSLVDDLTADPACDAVLLHGDLHYGTVLSDGTDWVAVDPKPMAGHPAFEIAPMLSNRAEEMGTGASLRYLVRRRLEVLCEGAEIAWETGRDWTVVREVVAAMWAARDGDRARVSLAMAILKAIDD